MIDTLIYEHFKNPNEMTFQMVIDEVKTFLAGWDSTTWATTFTLQMIGSYPEVQEKLFQEIE